MVNKPLLRPYFWLGCLSGGRLTRHNYLPYAIPYRPGQFHLLRRFVLPWLLPIMMVRCQGMMVFADADDGITGAKGKGWHGFPYHVKRKDEITFGQIISTPHQLPETRNISKFRACRGSPSNSGWWSTKTFLRYSPHNVIFFLYRVVYVDFWINATPHEIPTYPRNAQHPPSPSKPNMQWLPVLWLFGKGQGFGMLARFATEWPLLGCWGKRSDFVWRFRVEEMVTPKQLSYLHLSGPSESI